MQSITMNGTHVYLKRSQLGETRIDAASGATPVPTYIANWLIRLGYAT